jgi:hypothetical protein
LPQRPVGNQILSPEPFHRFLNHRQLVMAVEASFAQAGEVLAASQNFSFLQSR